MDSNSEPGTCLPIDTSNDEGLNESRPNGQDQPMENPQVAEPDASLLIDAPNDEGVNESRQNEQDQPMVNPQAAEPDTSLPIDASNDQGPKEIPRDGQDQPMENPAAELPGDLFVSMDPQEIEGMQAIWNYTYQENFNWADPSIWDNNTIPVDEDNKELVLIEDTPPSTPHRSSCCGTPKDNVKVEPDSDSDWPDDTENELKEKLHAAQIHFKSLPDPSMEDVVELRKAEFDELCRQNKVKTRRSARGLPKENLRSLKTEDALPESSMVDYKDFLNLEADDIRPAENSPSQVPRKASKAGKGKNIMVTEREKQKAMEIGLSSIIGRNELTAELYCRSKSPTGRRRRSGKANQTLSEEELRSIFGQGDLIVQAQISSSLPEMHTSKEATKRNALADMVASIPSADKKSARSDSKAFDEATKAFVHTPRLAPDGKWRLRGLKTTLMYHQILAVGWMRKRENSSTNPRGGLLCDTMGFGKTLTAIANIIDGGNSIEKAPTLIVIPSSLRVHWSQQIQRHCDPDFLAMPFEYRNIRSFGEDFALKCLKKQDVVLTTYEEVRKSYASTKVPKGMTLKAEITAWWIEKYDGEIELLHKVKWHRIILDECHMIKNRHSQVSVAIRALTGKFRWLMSGTPLHNCIEELYPYFNFLGVSKCFSFGEFDTQFCDGGDRNSRNRLINILRSILHRKTHESRLFGAPIIKLPPIKQKDIRVDFCKAEWLLYEKMGDVFIQHINDLSEDVQCQRHCILTMFLKMRMFSSHLLTAQDIVQYILKHDGALSKLKLLADQQSSDEASSKIVNLILSAMADEVNRASSSSESNASIEVQPLGDLNTLIREFRDLMATSRDEEKEERLRCQSCSSDPLPAVITSCRHLYCEECYMSLPEGNGNPDTQGYRICCSCYVDIDAVAIWSSFDKITESSAIPQLSTSSSRKRQRDPEITNSAAEQSDFARWTKAFPKLKRSKRSKGSSRYGMFHSSEAFDDEDFGDEPEELIRDWIPMIGPGMPTAKLTKAREIIKSWIEADSKAKIVVFVFFLSSIELFGMMCKEEKWAFKKLSGKMSQTSRDESISEFQTNEDIRILIATYKTGGFGIDLSKANKCILVDLWWNEAVEYQAYGRLLRLNQTREMECIKLVVKRSFDERMLEKQKIKTSNIEQVMSQKVLNDRATIKELLSYFGDVTDTKGGGFKINRHSRGDHDHQPVDLTSE